MSTQEERAKRAAYMRAWAAKNPEKARANARASYYRHRARRLADAAAWAAKNPEKARAAKRRWQAKWEKEHPEVVREWGRRWKKAHPEAGRKAAGRRRAREHGALVADVALSVLEKEQGGLCYLCSSPFNGDSTIDHLVPLSRGGTHSPENCAAAHKGCNSRKHTKLMLLALVVQHKGRT